MDLAFNSSRQRGEFFITPLLEDAQAMFTVDDSDLRYRADLAALAATYPTVEQEMVYVENMLADGVVPYGGRCVEYHPRSVFWAYVNITALGRHGRDRLTLIFEKEFVRGSFGHCYLVLLYDNHGVGSYLDYDEVIRERLGPDG